MFSKVKIKDQGDTEFIVGQIVDFGEAFKVNAEVKSKNKKEAVFEEEVLGITRVALKTESFLSAASFQETTSVLIDAATRGAVDRLQGLKENVIIGRLIPAGTALVKK
jgi:DNA-directed RNA polymerase subunit beta'